MNNLSVYLRVTRRGLNQGGCCHVFSTRGRGWECVCVDGGWEGAGGLSGRRRTAVPAELPSRAVTASSARSLSGRRVRESSFSI